MTHPTMSAPPTLTKPRVHKELVDRLARRIVGGEFTPHRDFPTEQMLCQEYGVSRSAVREAIRVLATRGMLESRPRVGTRVLDQEQWNFLDPHVLEWIDQTTGWYRFIDDLMDVRLVVEPMAAELAARRATAAEVAMIEAAFLRMAHNLGAAPEEATRGDVAFHIAILRASHNVIYAQLANSFEVALTKQILLANNYNSHKQSTQEHLAVLDAIRLRQPDEARRLMTQMLLVGQRNLKRVRGEQARDESPVAY
ncbi:FadR/GntR family transcriptional regulator [Deinococcus peraridilitoris]|uniref:FadR/GntR family transcriptional regulator n=1 Tax=Deinococcus peraridilitoris TaxID=432329 RepID=UPI00145E8CDE|nr:FadR/GntR family transcriptional regulator [Deinococcus peraridilitoris]